MAVHSLLAMRKLWLLIVIFQVQSCALLTSFKQFELKKNTASSFGKKLCYSDNPSYSLCFYEDGSSLLVQAINPDEMATKYDIYGKFDDEFFHWGVYQIQEDTIALEFLQKVDQWGFMGLRRWEAVLHSDSTSLSILPGPVNDKRKELSYFTLPDRKLPY